MKVPKSTMIGTVLIATIKTVLMGTFVRVRQSVVKPIVAYFTAIVQVIAEAASAMLDWIVSAVRYVVDAALKPIIDWIMDWKSRFIAMIENSPEALGLSFSRAGVGPVGAAFESIIQATLELMTIVQVVVIVLTAAGIIAEQWAKAGTLGTSDVIVGVLMTILQIAVFGLATEVLKDILTDLGSFSDLVESKLPGGAEILENEVAARDLMLSVVGFVWALLSAVFTARRKNARSEGATSP